MEKSARIHAYGSSHRHCDSAGGDCRGGAIGACFYWFEFGESQRLFGAGVRAAADGLISEPAAQYVDQSASVYRNYRRANLHLLSRRPDTAIKHSRWQPHDCVLQPAGHQFCRVAGDELQLHLSGSERSLWIGLRRQVGGDHYDELSGMVTSKRFILGARKKGGNGIYNPVTLDTIL